MIMVNFMLFGGVEVLKQIKKVEIMIMVNFMLFGGVEVLKKRRRWKS